jgi:hypothetical protein
MTVNEGRVEQGEEETLFIIVLQNTVQSFFELRQSN